MHRWSSMSSRNDFYVTLTLEGSRIRMVQQPRDSDIMRLTAWHMRSPALRPAWSSLVRKPPRTLDADNLIARAANLTIATVQLWPQDAASLMVKLVAVFAVTPSWSCDVSNLILQWPHMPAFAPRTLPWKYVEDLVWFIQCHIDVNFKELDSIWRMTWLLLVKHGKTVWYVSYVFSDNLRNNPVHIRPYMTILNYPRRFWRIKRHEASSASCLER